MSEHMTPEQPPTRPRVVVGVDGSPGSNRALAWAATEAARRGAGLVTVTVWQWDGLEAMPLAGATPLEAERLATDLADREIAKLPDPSVVTQRLVVRGTAGAALVDASRGADLLVLGSHGHGAFHAAVLGSVSRHCVGHADCPVVILPLPRAARLPKPAKPAKPAATSRPARERHPQDVGPLF